MSVLDVAPSSDVAELLRQMKHSAFNARRLGLAYEILKEAFEANSACFLGVAGALAAGGMRAILAKLIEKAPFELVVSTGANVLHDLAAALGKPAFHLEAPSDDVALAERGVMRIHDVFTSAESYIAVESLLRGVVEELPDGCYASYDLVKRLGEKVNDPRSFVHMASRRGVHVIVPAFIDSVLGLQFSTIISQRGKIGLDQVKDLNKIIEIQFDAKEKGRATAALILGGGVPKNFIFQSTLIAEKPLDYVVQVTVDVPEYGGLSGATLSEAKSWRKVRGGAKAVTVYCDATIALPLLVSALFQNR